MLRVDKVDPREERRGRGVQGAGVRPRRWPIVQAGSFCALLARALGALERRTWIQRRTFRVSE